MTVTGTATKRPRPHSSAPTNRAIQREDQQQQQVADVVLHEGETRRDRLPCTEILIEDEVHEERAEEGDHQTGQDAQQQTDEGHDAEDDAGQDDPSQLVEAEQFTEHQRPALGEGQTTTGEPGLDQVAPDEAHDREHQRDQHGREATAGLLDDETVLAADHGGVRAREALEQELQPVDHSTDEHEHQHGDQDRADVLRELLPAVAERIAHAERLTRRTGHAAAGGRVAAGRVTTAGRHATGRRRRGRGHPTTGGSGRVATGRAGRRRRGRNLATTLRLLRRHATGWLTPGGRGRRWN